MIFKNLVQTVLLLFILTSVSCKSNKMYSAETLPTEFVEFGSINEGSGTTISWIFLKNGQVFYKTPLYTEEQKRLSKAMASSIFMEAAKVKKSGFHFNQDGTSKAFISYRGESHHLLTTWIWPYGGTKIYPDEMKLLYNLCLEATRATKIN